MKAKYILALATIWVLFGSCTEKELSENGQPYETQENSENDDPVVRGEAVIRFTDDMIAMIEDELDKGSIPTKSSELSFIAEQMGIKSMKRLFPHAGKFEPRTRVAGLHKWYTVVFDDSIPFTKAEDDLGSIPGIETVEPVYRSRQTTFNDPEFKRQWHYYNDGTLTSSHKAGADINVSPVWENYTVGNENVIVAVVDGGIDQTHEDLAANCIGGINYVSGGTTIKAHSHGTHVAGTVAAINNNGKGVCGIAGGNSAAGINGVKLLSLQIFEHDPNDPNKDIGGTQGYTAIKEGADKGAVISQNSWGASFETKEDMEAAKKAGIPGYVKDAVNYFIDYAGIDENGNQAGPMKGGVVIVAAGNDGWDWGIPGAYEPVIAVGSIAPDFTRAYYSNYGSWVDIAAPGGSAYYTDGQVYSTLPGNQYGWMQGTSMACPHVSGVAALIVSHFGGPGFTNEMLVNKLINGTRPNVISQSAQIGNLLDAQGAFAYGGSTPPDKVSSYTAEAKSNSVVFKWKVTNDQDDRKAYAYVLMASVNASSLENPNYSSLPSDVISSIVLTGNANVGDELEGSIEGLEFSTPYHVTLAGFDYNKNYSQIAEIKSITTGENHAPVISTEYDGNYEIRSHDVLSVPFEITDPDGHSVEISLFPGSDAVKGEKNPVSGKFVVTFTGNADEPGKYEAVITATDAYGMSSSETIEYEIIPNQAPVIVKDIEDMMFSSIGQKFSLDMTEYIEDPDGEQLKFDIAISDRNLLHINPSGNILNATVLNFGLVNVTITATDSRNETCTLTFQVLTKNQDTLVEVFPNPVIDILTVRTGDEAETGIRIYSSSGATVYNNTSAVSAFSPAKIDMSSCAPGNYRVEVTINGNTYKKSIVKL